MLNQMLFVGASSKVGRLVKKCWMDCPKTALDLHFQYRNAIDCKYQSDVYLDPWTSLIRSSQSEIQYDTICIFSGVTSNHPNIDLNTAIAHKWLDFALDRGYKKVILASSSAVYGLARDRPFVELDVPYPSSQYGVSKLRMENSLEEYRRSGISICCLRIGNVLGADSLWLNKNIASVECPIKLDRFANGLGPLRSYIEPSTLLDVLIALSHTEARDLPQCLNLANPQPTSMHDILHALGVPWEWKPGSVEASQNIVLNCSLLEKFFSFSDIETSAATMVNNVLKIEGFA